MATYPYSTSPNNLKKFVKTIPNIGVPDSVTTRWLPSVGYKSKNDRTIVTCLKFVGLIDSSGKPTPLWANYRDSKNGPPLLGQAIRKSYEPLFKTYPDADRKDNEALTNFFKVGTTAGERAIQFTVQTFRALCECAEFDATMVQSSILDSQTDKSGLHAVGKGTAVLRDEFNIRPTVAINIELHLPAADNPEIYDKLFAAMRKHLFPDKED